MIKSISLGAMVLLSSFSVNATENLITYESPYSVQQTADRFASIAQSKGLNVFARIDHQKNAEGVGLSLRPTQVILFGNPKVGTPLMNCAQNMAIDLPQKALISEDAEQRVWLSFNHPEYLKVRHNIKGCDALINKVTNVLNMLGKTTVEH
ncbi:DUF302 domain-containing protein [Marinomonas pollencensis]|uniref:Uncharacterized protein (DUF302 family) n=1 Tax=Marinomonas pollencensis TaxID=491954 RepID=A0A3E0DJI5_9GAMM|nr:DUF302 domain-containing protein [Marinomonas pollencensis]REG82903.1 uncharacterized protein (DUF302 family) [Marinomonas pollencensis]